MILQIDTISNTKASLIANAEVIEGTGVIPLAEWLSPDQKKKLTVSLQKGHVTQDKEKLPPSLLPPLQQRITPNGLLMVID